MREKEEIFNIVDNRNNIIGQASRSEVHSKKLMHRSVHIFVFNSLGDLFLQKRSMLKDESPGLWDISVAGHVGLGENYQTCAYRELEEELGLDSELTDVMCVPAQENTSWEHIHVYKCVTDNFIQINQSEISEGRYWALSEIRLAVVNTPKYFTKSFRLLFSYYFSSPKFDV